MSRRPGSNLIATEGGKGFLLLISSGEPNQTMQWPHTGRHGWNAKAWNKLLMLFHSKKIYKTCI